MSTSTPKGRPLPPVALPAVAPETALEATITTRRAELIAELVHLKPDTSVEAIEARARLKATLSTLGHIIKDNVVDGWAKLEHGATVRLDQWLVESKRS